MAKTTIITGTSGGLGGAVARRLPKNGFAQSPRTIPASVARLKSQGRRTAPFYWLADALMPHALTSLLQNAP